MRVQWILEIGAEYLNAVALPACKGEGEDLRCVNWSRWLSGIDPYAEFT